MFSTDAARNHSDPKAPASARNYLLRLRRFKWIAACFCLLPALLYMLNLIRIGRLRIFDYNLVARTGDISFQWLLSSRLALLGLLILAILTYALSSRLRAWQPATPRGRSLLLFGVLLFVFTVGIIEFLRFVDFQPLFLTLAAIAALPLAILLSTTGSDGKSTLERLGHGLCSERAGRWLPWLLMPAAAAISRWGALTVFDDLIVVSDAQSQIAQARLMLTGHLCLDGADAFVKSVAFPLSTPGIPSFSQYPPGHILLNWLGIALGCHPRTVSIAVSALSVPLAMALARRIGGRSAALFAGLLMITSPWFIIMSPTAMNHTSAGMTLALAALCLMPRAQGRAVTFPILVLGWACIGWTIATRPLTGLVHGAVWGGLLTLGALRAREIRFSRWVAVAVGLAPTLGGLFVYQYFTSGKPFTLGYTARDTAMHYLGFRSWGPYPFTPLNSLNDLASSLLSMNALVFGLPFGAWLLVTLWWLGTRLGRVERILILLIAAQTLAYRFYHFHDLLLGPRFLYELLPMLIALGAAGLARLLRGGFARRMAGAVVIAILCISGVKESMPFWTSRWAVATTKGNQLRDFIEANRPFDQPTVIVIPPSMDEDAGTYVFSRDSSAPRWFVLAPREQLARGLPEFAGMRWLHCQENMPPPSPPLQNPLPLPTGFE